MAPSGEHRIEDLGAATVQAAALAASNAAAALRGEVGRLHAEGKGLTVAKSCDEMTARAGAAEKLFATLAATAKALKIREDAARAWNRDAPKDSEIKAAEEAVTAAKKKLQDASAASGDTSAASTELENAQKKLGVLLRKRREADKAYDKAEKRADLELAKITPQDISDDAPGTGTTSTGTGTGTGSPSGTGRPSGETGKRSDPSKTSGSGSGKPSTTPAGTPSPSTTPTETTTSTATPESVAALAALLGQQQQPQPQAQQPTTQATPAAATPQAQQQPDKDKGADTEQSKTNPWDKIVGGDGILDNADLATLGIGAPLTLGGGSAPTHSTPAAAVTPSAPASSTPSATGLSASATANAQPITSGTSAQGLNTNTDVSGRAGEARNAFSPTGPETKTSGATGTGTSTPTAHAAGTRPMGAGGMPMVPMGAMGGPGGAGKDREQAQTTLASGSEESYYLHGRQAVDSAVPGGTIAQKDHPRRRPPESDAA
ncbi:hypothetical protein [Mycobacteroides abscessus]|uniref:hypothetical protein n=1 Tax=Mycobacteroides abscessus TaxID=36809 RepID=UPI000C263419|nr:hypothetical protein [Mycobacteroides abscessus]